jgi:hypothetical protein
VYDAADWHIRFAGRYSPHGQTGRYEPIKLAGEIGFN